MKRLVQYCFLVIAALPWLWWKIFSPLVGTDPAFQGASQFCALLPGRSGELLRAAFYRLSLKDSSQNIVIGFLTTLSSVDAKLGNHVSTGVCCNIGKVEIGDDSLVSAYSFIASGRKQHRFSDWRTPIRMQGGERSLVRIGRDCWIGAGAIVLADIGEGSVVAAGSVVMEPVPPYSIVSGNPAKIIRSRITQPDDGAKTSGSRQEQECRTDNGIGEQSA